MLRAYGFLTLVVLGIVVVCYDTRVPHSTFFRETKHPRQSHYWQQGFNYTEWMQQGFNYTEWMLETAGGMHIKDFQPPNNLHIVFMGDSVTRFMYIAFRQWMHTGQFIKNSDRPKLLELPRGERLLNFHENMVTGEQCDCIRSKEYRPHLQKENRYYHNDARNMTLTFIEKTGRQPAKGGWLPDQVNNNHSLQTNFEPPLWEYNWSATIRHHIALLKPKPNYIVFNSGLHDDGGLSEQHVREDILQALKDTGITGIYKTTSWMRGRRKRAGTGPHDLEMCNLTREMSPCIVLDWTKQLKSSDYRYDGVHFKTAPYSRMVQQLMEIVNMLEGGEQEHMEIKKGKSLQ